MKHLRIQIKKNPKFLNIGILANFEKDYLDLFTIVKQIEKKIGRIKSKRNDPRVIDIDIIDFDNLIKNKKIDLTSPKVPYKKFCLVPY